MWMKQKNLFGEPSLAGFDLEGFEQLIRPWPTREAQDRFEMVFNQISADL